VFAERVAACQFAVARLGVHVPELGVSAEIGLMCSAIVNPVVGRSAAVIALRPTAPDAPLGVARNWLAVCPVAALMARLPEPVTGDPDTVSHDGAVSPTLVTVPVPAGRSLATSARNVGAAALPLEGPAKTMFAD
jgi:hypothetical protein